MAGPTKHSQYDHVGRPKRAATAGVKPTLPVLLATGNWNLQQKHNPNKQKTSNTFGSVCDSLTPDGQRQDKWGLRQRRGSGGRVIITVRVGSCAHVDAISVSP